jgi:hypothetical protein
MKILIDISIFNKKYLNVLFSLILFVIVISGCTDATFNPNSPVDTAEKEKIEKHKSTLELLTKYTWQMIYVDQENNNNFTLMTLKFNLDGSYIKEVFSYKQFHTWTLSEDSKYIFTKNQDIASTSFEIDTLEILMINEENLHLEVLNDNDPGKSILTLVPYNPQFAKFNLQSLIINNTQNFTFPNLRLIIVWEVYTGGNFKEFIWGYGNVDSNLIQYEINFDSEPPIHCLNVIDSKKMLGFAKVILTKQTDLPLEGDVTGKINADMIVGGLNGKAIIYKFGDYTDSSRPWIRDFGQSYNIGESSKSNNISWMYKYPLFPRLEIDYIYNLHFPKF